MAEDLSAMTSQALRELERTADEKALDAWRVAYLGRSGRLTTRTRCCVAGLVGTCGARSRHPRHLRHMTLETP